MSRIKEALENKKTFIPFVTGGDPDLETTKKIILEMQDAGADMIEVGIPFSDPIAEGVVIQEADLRALENGCTTDKLFDALKEIKDEVKVPLVFVTYMNVVYKYGCQKFVDRSVECGIDGVAIPDCCYEEKGEFYPFCKEAGIDYISYIAPATKERIAMIAKEAEGYVYCVSSDNVPDKRKDIINTLEGIVSIVKENTDIPFVIGCNDLTPDKNQKMLEISDGVSAESDVVKIIAEHGSDSGFYVAEYVKLMKS